MMMITLETTRDGDGAECTGKRGEIAEVIEARKQDMKSSLMMTTIEKER